MTQRDQVLTVLRDAGQPGVCANVFLRMFIPRAGARIHELRRDGWLIDSWVCREHTHAGNTARYRLRGRYVGGVLEVPQGVFQVDTITGGER